MKIGIDIDDTTVMTVEAMVKYGDIYDGEDLGRTGVKGNLGLIKNRYYLKALYGWTEEEKFAFFDKYYAKVLQECYPLPDAPEVIRKLKEEGHEIIFITARLTNVKTCNTPEITKRNLEDNNIPYDKLIINASDKLRYCKEEGIQIFIEDSFETCKTLEENGIKSYLMTTRMNADIDAGNVERVSSWDEIYSKIQNFINENK